MIKKLFFCSAIFIQVRSANIVFDLGDIFLTRDKAEMMRRIGKKEEDFKPLFIKYLPLISKADLGNLPAVNFETNAGGTPLPKIAVHTMRSDLPIEDIHKAIQLAIEKEGIDENEKKMFQEINDIFYKAEVDAGIHKIIPEGLDLLNSAYDSYDRAGNKNRLFMLSNLNSELFDALYKKYPDIFKMFDGIVISARSSVIMPDGTEREAKNFSDKYLKPQTEIFDKLLDPGANLMDGTQWKLDPDETYFIDDQADNCKVAEQKGIHVFCCPKPADIAKAQEQMIQEGIINKLTIWGKFIKMLRAIF